MKYADYISREFRWAGHTVDFDRLFGDPEYRSELRLLSGQEEAVEFLSDWCSAQDFIEVYSSGTTGTPKAMRLSKVHMLASARKSVSFFRFAPGIRGLMVLPARFIGGKMLLLRAFISGMHLDFLEPTTRLKLPKGSRWDFVSLTPHLAHLNPHLVRCCRIVLLGGAPSGLQLQKQWEGMDTRVYESYGATETMSHVALRKVFPAPQQAFQALPGIRFSLNEQGCLCIHAPELGLENLQTSDTVELLGTDRFVWKGRQDFVINSGGIKIHPEGIENILSAILERTLLLVPRPHPELGQEAVLVIEGEEKDRKEVSLLLKTAELSRHERPRDLVFIPALPRTPGNKPDRRKLIRQLAGNSS